MLSSVHTRGGLLQVPLMVEDRPRWARLIRDISVRDFIAEASNNSVHVRSPEAPRLRELLLQDGVSVASAAAGELDVTGLSSDEIGVRAAAAGIVLLELAPRQASLEQAFMELTHDSVEYRAPAAPGTTQHPTEQEIAA